MSDLQLYGIRHHGPGSTASLLKALDDYQPDIVLLECPADGEKALALAVNPDLRPPVALLQPQAARTGHFSALRPLLARVADRSSAARRPPALLRSADGLALCPPRYRGARARLAPA